MSDRTDTLAQVLFNKPSLHDCSLQQVDYLAHQYPYFNTAQLLLLQKTGSDSESYSAQLQRTALHFSHPLQLQYWLHPEVFETELPEAELFQTPIPEAPEVTVETNEIAESEAVQDVVIAEPETTVPETVETETEAPSKVTATEVLTKEPTPEIEQSETDSEATTPEPQVTETSVLSSEPNAPQKEAQPEASGITFEPFHTVDYFASQGIKLSQQEASNDKLGKQLKSFTEWLKTMKRLPATTLPQTGDTASEHKVEALAAHSLNTADIVTESMAEVWLKQGNTQKAADVYRKLSLQNPAKSAYFAAKIESLNHRT